MSAQSENTFKSQSRYYADLPRSGLNLALIDCECKGRLAEMCTFVLLLCLHLLIGDQLFNPPPLPQV
jgi:hypothetical protein